VLRLPLAITLCVPMQLIIADTNDMDARSRHLPNGILDMLLTTDHMTKQHIIQKYTSTALCTTSNTIHVTKQHNAIYTSYYMCRICTLCVQCAAACSHKYVSLEHNQCACIIAAYTLHNFKTTSQHPLFPEERRWQPTSTWCPLETWSVMHGCVVD